MEAVTDIGSFTGIGFTLDLTHSGGDQRRRGASSVASRTGRHGGQDASDSTDATGLSLSPEKEEKVRALEQRDREVRAHEQAHQAAAGGLASGGASFTLRQGPDGQMYAVGGEVHIDTSEESDPDATIAKARQIRAAANAPAEPSAQDKAVAAQAAQMEASARREKAEEQTGRTSIGGPASVSGPATLSGPPELSGPTAAVSGPPNPLTPPGGEFGRGGPDDVDGPFTAASRRTSSRNAENAYAAQQTAAAQADAAAAWQTTQAQLAAEQAAADAAYSRQQEVLNADAAAAYARAWNMQALDTQAMYGGSSPPEQVQFDLQPIDVTRAAGPATAMAAGVYPLDRPTDLLSAQPTAASLRLPATAPARVDTAQTGARAPLRTAAALTEPSPVAMQRASRAYQRVGHVPTSLAPFGTGISRTA